MKGMAVLAVDCCSSSLYGLPHSINFSMTDVVLGKFQEGNLCHYPHGDVTTGEAEGLGGL